MTLASLLIFSASWSFFVWLWCVIFFPVIIGFLAEQKRRSHPLWFFGLLLINMVIGVCALFSKPLPLLDWAVACLLVNVLPVLLMCAMPSKN